MSQTPRKVYGLLAILIFLVEVFIAKGHVPRFARGSLGDVLVVILIYCTAKTVRNFKPAPLALGVFLFACGIEGLQYIHLVDILGLRHGSILAIMIGNTFSWGDIGMYAIGCSVALGADLAYSKA